MLYRGSTQGWRFTLRGLSGVASHSEGSRGEQRGSCSAEKAQVAPDGPAELPKWGEILTQDPQGVMGRAALGALSRPCSPGPEGGWAQLPEPPSLVCGSGTLTTL